MQSKVYRLQDHKSCQYDPIWQEVRINCLGHWNTKEGVIKNLKRLIEYLAKIGGGINRTKVWQELNLMNAVRMGYHGQGLVGTDMDKLVIEYQTQLSAKYKKYSANEPLVILSPEETLKRWNGLSPISRQKIKDNLSKRLKAHSESEYRDDLRRFLDIINGEYVDEWVPM